MLDELIELNPASLGDDAEVLTRVANRLMRKMTELEVERQANLACCQAEVQELQQRTQELNYPLEQQINGLGNHLEYVARCLIGEGTKRSRRLLHGEIGLRKHGASVVIDDGEALLQSLLVRDPVPGPGKLVVYPPAPGPRVDKKALDKHVLETGEALPGTHVEPEADRFNYKLLGLD